jgi:RNA-directed DNA polymerase
VEPSSLGLRLLRVKLKTEKTRLRRSLLSLQDLVRRIRHLTIPDQAGDLNAVLRGHYAYYGIAGNIRALQKVYRAVERYWRKMLCSRSWAGPPPDLGGFRPDQRADPVTAT